MGITMELRKEPMVYFISCGGHFRSLATSWMLSIASAVALFLVLTIPFLWKSPTYQAYLPFLSVISVNDFCRSRYLFCDKESSKVWISSQDLSKLENSIPLRLDWPLSVLLSHCTMHSLSFSLTYIYINSLSEVSCKYKCWQFRLLKILWLIRFKIVRCSRCLLAMHECNTGLPASLGRKLTLKWRLKQNRYKPEPVAVVLININSCCTNN